MIGIIRKRLIQWLFSNAVTLKNHQKSKALDFHVQFLNDDRDKHVNSDGHSYLCLHRVLGYCIEVLIRMFCLIQRTDRSTT